MLSHEKKIARQKGETVERHYKPRAPHPLLQPKQEADQQQTEAISNNEPVNSNNNEASDATGGATGS
jgi:hypothetical protein